MESLSDTKPNHITPLPNLICAGLFTAPIVLFLLLKLYLFVALYSYVILFSLIASLANVKFHYEIPQVNKKIVGVVNRVFPLQLFKKL